MRTAGTIVALAAIATGLLLVSPGAAQTPSPDLAAMALAPSDVGSQARVRKQGYVRVQGGLAYVRTYRFGTARVGRKPLLTLESTIEVAPTAALASRFMRAIPAAFRQLDPDALANDFERASGGIRVTDVRLGKTARLRAGDRTYAKTIRLRTRVGALYVVVAFVQVDRVVATLSFSGLPNAKVGAREAGVLGRALAKRITAGLRPASRSLPTLPGTPIFVGQALGAGPGLWTNAPTSYTYEWRRCDPSGTVCSTIPGATDNTYTLTTSDAGFKVRVRVTARNRHGAASATSAASQLVAGPPANTAPPTISGTIAQGQLLTAVLGTWTGGGLVFTVQWRRCDATGGACTDIANASTQQYALGPADTGFTIRVAVTGRNAAGSATAESAQTTVVP
jgi:hypothetical protein